MTVLRRLAWSVGARAIEWAERDPAITTIDAVKRVETRHTRLEIVRDGEELMVMACGRAVRVRLADLTDDPTCGTDAELADACCLDLE